MTMEHFDFDNESHKATPVVWRLEGGVWGGGTDETEQGNCLCERRVSVKAGTGRRLELTSEGKDFPKPLCKTTADPAADSSTRPAAAFEKLTDSTSYRLSCGIGEEPEPFERVSGRETTDITSPI